MYEQKKAAERQKERPKYDWRRQNMSAKSKLMLNKIERNIDIYY